MKMYFSAQTGGFYDSAINGDSIPSDAVEITRQKHAEMMAGQTNGQAIGFDEDGFPVLLDVSPDMVKGRLSAAVQDHMDGAARSLGYDDIKSAVTYADEPAVLKFQQEGQALREWRSLCWASCYEVMADVEAGTRPTPTVAELVAELPELVLP